MVGIDLINLRLSAAPPGARSTNPYRGICETGRIPSKAYALPRFIPRDPTIIKPKGDFNAT